MSKFKTGDKAFCTSFGDGIVRIKGDDSLYPLEVDFAFTAVDYTLDGLWHKDSKHPSLFHSPKEAAEYFSKIKRKEKRVIKVWVNVYPEDYSFHTTREIADRYAPSPRIACVPIEQEVGFEV